MELAPGRLLQCLVILVPNAQFVDQGAPAADSRKLKKYGSIEGKRGAPVGVRAKS